MKYIIITSFLIWLLTIILIFVNSENIDRLGLEFKICFHNHNEYIFYILNRMIQRYYLHINYRIYIANCYLYTLNKIIQRCYNVFAVNWNMVLDYINCNS